MLSILKSEILILQHSQTFWQMRTDSQHFWGKYRVEANYNITGFSLKEEDITVLKWEQEPHGIIRLAYSSSNFELLMQPQTVKKCFYWLYKETFKYYVILFQDLSDPLGTPL